MEPSLWSVLVLAAAIMGSAINAAKIEDESEASKMPGFNKDKANSPLDQRVRLLEGELQRVKSRLSEVENLLDAWFLSAEQQPSMTAVKSADVARWIADENGDGGLEKRAGGGWAFKGSRGKRKPFILGSRGKRAVDYDAIEEGSLDAIENDKNDMGKRGAYFYGSRGKKQANERFLTTPLDDNEDRQMPPDANKRYSFMGSRGKK